MNRNYSEKIYRIWHSMATTENRSWAIAMNSFGVGKISKEIQRQIIVNTDMQLIKYSVDDKGVYIK